MHRSIVTLPLLAIVWSGAALAGEEPLYAPAPDWVEQADMEDVVGQSGPADLLRDWQYRIEDGVVHAFTDVALRIDNPQALMQHNTQTLTWLPDKGDLTIHHFEIHRAGEVIDLVEQGVTFAVLRREQGLENRLLDGQLTATVSVPGLREGDVLRIAHSVSVDDQALGDEVQATQFLPSAPLQVGLSRARISWPADEEMFWAAEERVALAEPVLRDGYRYLSVDLPLAEPDPIPNDAPFRFRRPAVLRVGSFASWEELSAVMTPHFESAATIESGSSVAQQAAAIMAQTDDQLVRAALAVRLVQEEVSYLLNGLEGGNYLPQSAEETWDVRYGDCKAKSVLLLALLRQMGIESETVLVSSRAGDAVPELLPLPAAFDHMIVRAVIAGTQYWLDGTSSATRLSNITDVPPFHYALPLRDGGAGLIPMAQRDPAEPQFTAIMNADHSAGFDFPQLFTMEVRTTGPQGSRMRAMVDADDPEAIRRMARQFSSSEGMQVSNLTVTYDDEAALATITVEGIGAVGFVWEDGRLRSEIDALGNLPSFNPDRARPAWRDIPVATGGPGRFSTIMELVLPQDGTGFALDGEANQDVAFANIRVSRQMVLDRGTLRAVSDVFATLGEIPAADLPDAKRAARQLQGNVPQLVPPADVVWRWDLTREERERRAAPILSAYQAAINFADEDNYQPRIERARFLATIFDFDAAMADYDFLVEKAPSVALLDQRSWLHEALGDAAGAIADRQAAYDLDPSPNNARALAHLLAYDGQVAEALELLEFLPMNDADRPYQANRLAHVMALGGDVAGGHALIEEMVADLPQNTTALNGDCWFRGLFAVALDSAIARCTQSVERASNVANALDSRALVHFRLGQLDEALADLDAALALDPELAASRYLRGIVRLQQGDAGGRGDIATGLLMEPQLERFYLHHGIAPLR